MSGPHTSDQNNLDRIPVCGKAKDTAARLHEAIEVLKATSPITVKDTDLQAKLDATFDQVGDFHNIGLDANNRLDAANHYLTQMKVKQEAQDAAGCLKVAATITMHLTLALIRAKSDQDVEIGEWPECNKYVASILERYDEDVYCGNGWTEMHNAMLSLILNPLTYSTNTSLDGNAGAVNAIARIFNAATLLVTNYTRELELSKPGDFNRDLSRRVLFIHGFPCYPTNICLKQPYYITRIAMRHIKRFDNMSTKE